MAQHRQQWQICCIAWTGGATNDTTFYSVLPFRFSWHTCWWAAGGRAWERLSSQSSASSHWRNVSPCLPLGFSLTLPFPQFASGFWWWVELPSPQLTQLGSVLALGSSFTQRDSSQSLTRLPSDRKVTVSFPEEAVWGTLPSFFVDPTSILFAKRWVRRVLPLPVEEQAREMGASFLQCRSLPHTARPVSLQVPRTAWSLCTCQTRGCVCGPFSLNISSSFYSTRYLILYCVWTMCREEVKINLWIQF